MLNYISNTLYYWFCEPGVSTILKLEGWETNYNNETNNWRFYNINTHRYSNKYPKYTSNAITIIEFYNNKDLSRNETKELLNELKYNNSNIELIEKYLNNFRREELEEREREREREREQERERERERERVEEREREQERERERERCQYSNCSFKAQYGQYCFNHVCHNGQCVNFAGNSKYCSICNDINNVDSDDYSDDGYDYFTPAYSTGYQQASRCILGK